VAIGSELLFAREFARYVHRTVTFEEFPKTLHEHFTSALTVTASEQLITTRQCVGANFDCFVTPYCLILGTNKSVQLLCMGKSVIKVDGLGTLGSMDSGSGDVPFSNSETLLNTTQSSTLQLTNFLASIPAALQLVLCAMVLKVVCQTPDLRGISSLPVINLISSDFLRAIVGFLAISVFGISRAYEPSVGENVLCGIVMFVNNAQMAWSGWAIVIVAYSRLDTVVNVLSPKFTRRQFWFFAVTSWLVAVITSLPPLVGWSAYTFQKNGNRYSCRTTTLGKGLLHAFYLPFFYFLNFLIPSTLITVWFSRLFGRARRHLRARTSHNSNIVFLCSTEANQKKQKERSISSAIQEIIKSKAFQYVLAIVLSNLLLVAPFACVSVYGTICDEVTGSDCLPNSAYQITSVLFMINFNVNAFLYVFWVKTFRNASVNLCCHIQCKRGSV
jgi:hypothetical protein